MERKKKDNNKLQVVKKSSILDQIDYWQLRKMIAKIIPRMTQLKGSNREGEIVREKGRKKNYQQFNLMHSEWRKQERLLNTKEINSFLEISVRAAACPMPFNMDIWDGLTCPYNCIYCFANAFRASLYTAFFDNSKTMGFRHCNSDYYKKEIDKMLSTRDWTMDKKQSLSGIQKAFALDIPVRLGIRFEDFLHTERKEGVSLQMLQYLKDIQYPVMINTKSDVPSDDKYLKALSENKAGAAVHVTLISSNETILKKLEPGAPSYAKRLAAIKKLCDSGIRVVARIEPYLFLITDDPDDMEKYMTEVWEAGVRHITLDTYSYTANNSGIRQIFMNEGYDYDRLFLAGADSQPLGSLLLGKFMELFQNFGFHCSTFDMGNTGINNDSICCEVGDWFKGGYNYGSTVMASRFIRSRQKQPTSWKNFEIYVEMNGGFLTETLKMEVKELWNLEGNMAYSHRWAPGIAPMGMDEDGIIWMYDEDLPDYRIELLKSII
jgi:DNA repair photolyase